MKYPFVSVVIACLNAEKALDKVLASVKKQNYPKNKIEILVIDGGSTDKTREIAKKYKCEVIDNPKVDQVYGKFMGYKKARGEFMLLLDSDEVLEDLNSIKFKVLSMLKDKRINVAISTGLKKPSNYPDINYYLNEFGDPFSFFMYHNSKNPQFFLRDLKRDYDVVYEDRDRTVFDFSKVSDPPFIELTAMGVMVNRDYIKKNFPRIFKDPPEHTHLYYLLNSRKNLFAVMKHDAIMHYSLPTFFGYLRKIRSRITSNVFGTGMGIAGFSGREAYHSSWYKVKKYLFPLYVLSVIFPLWDSLYLVLTRKKLIYSIHFVLAFYTLFLIIFFYTRKFLGLKTKLYNYGGK